MKESHNKWFHILANVNGLYEQHNLLFLLLFFFHVFELVTRSPSTHTLYDVPNWSRYSSACEYLCGYFCFGHCCCCFCGSRVVATEHYAVPEMHRVWEIELDNEQKKKPIQSDTNSKSFQVAKRWEARKTKTKKTHRAYVCGPRECSGAQLWLLFLYFLILWRCFYCRGTNRSSRAHITHTHTHGT